MSELGNDNPDSNEDMTGLDRVRKQLDRVLNRNDPNESERKKQVELRTEVDQLLAQHNIGSSSTDKCQKDDEPSIIIRLIEIKELLTRQEIVYQEKKRSRELRIRAISEYIVLGFTWAIGAMSMFIWLRM
jgi:hypothetical protein